MVFNLETTKCINFYAKRKPLSDADAVRGEGK